jgi:hypothetical protein
MMFFREKALDSGEDKKIKQDGISYDLGNVVRYRG